MTHIVGGGSEGAMLFASLLHIAYENQCVSHPLLKSRIPHIALSGNKKVPFIDVYLS